MECGEKFMALSYFKEVTVNIPRERAFELMEDSSRFGEWQDGFVSFEHKTGDWGEPGSTYELHYKMQGREIQMKETLIERRAPEVVRLTFEAGDAVWNSVDYTLTDNGDGTTHMRLDTVFKCKGITAVMAFFMPFMFKNQTQKSLDDFKAWAEAQA